MGITNPPNGFESGSETGAEVAPAPTPGVKGDAKTYHVLVYAQEGIYARNPFMLHVLSTQYPANLQFYIDYANKIISRYHKSGKMQFKYAGVEELPVSVGEGYFLFRSRGDFRGNMELVEAKGRVDLAKLAEFKSYRVTADLDLKVVTEGMFFDFVVNSHRVLGSAGLKLAFKPLFLRTVRGAHLRVRLAKPVSFEEKLKIRRDLKDDYNRVWFDEALYEAGYTGLTDILFNRKRFLSYGSYEEYAETPLQLTEITVPAVVEYVSNAVFEADSHYGQYSVIKFKNPIPVDLAYELYREFESNYKNKYVSKAKLTDLIMRRLNADYVKLKEKVDEVYRRLAENI